MEVSGHPYGGILMDLGIPADGYEERFAGYGGLGFHGEAWGLTFRPGLLY